MSRPSPYATLGGELHLSNFGQLELLRGMMERGVPLRTSVRGFSMAPFILDRDVLTIAPVGDQEPRVGEMVAFLMPGTEQLALHRVVARPTAGWLVRGDACLQVDGIVGRDQILGRVVRVEREGRDICLGLSVGGAWIAALSRSGQLARLSALRCSSRRAARVLHRTLSQPMHRVFGRGGLLRKRAGSGTSSL